MTKRNDQLQYLTNKNSMDHKYEEGDIVMYKKDNEIYKIVQIVQTGKVVSGITVESFNISNDHTKVNMVYAKDLELL